MLMKAHPPEPEPRRLSWRQRWGVALAIPAALLVGQGFDVAAAHTAQASCMSTVAQAKGGYDPGCPGPIGPGEKKVYRFTLMTGIGGLAGGLKGAAAAAGGAIVSWFF